MSIRVVHSAERSPHYRVELDADRDSGRIGQ